MPASQAKARVKQVLDAITDEPKTAAEVGREVGINPKAVQTILLEAYGARKIKMKKIGRYRLFWK